MADIIEKILTPADNFNLMTLDELKLSMQIDPGDTSQDAQLTQDIERFSDVVAKTCNRVFAYERVEETWRELGCQRIFLSHFPVREEDVETVESPRGTVLDPSQYEVEERSAKIYLINAASEPIVVTYSGGYNLPEDAPDALKQATELMIRQAQAMNARLLTSGIRSISHKDARVMYYDPTAMLRSSNSLMGKATSDAANALLMHFTRIQC